MAVTNGVKILALPKGWLAITALKPTFTFLVRILPSKGIEYPCQKKVKVGFRVEMASQPISLILFLSLENREENDT